MHGLRQRALSQSHWQHRLAAAGPPDSTLTLNYFSKPLHTALTCSMICLRCAGVPYLAQNWMMREAVWCWASSSSLPSTCVCAGGAAVHRGALSHVSCGVMSLC